MYGTVKQQLKRLTKEEYLILLDLCHTAKNLTNEALYNARQYYFENHKCIPYNDNCKLLKTSENFRILNANVAQHIIKEVDLSFQSYFALLKLAKQGLYPKEACQLPKYLSKDGLTTLVIAQIRIENNQLVFPYSYQYLRLHKRVQITIPTILRDKHIHQIRIKPMYNGRFFEVHYIYEIEDEPRKLDNNKALSLDLGVNNFVTAVTESGQSFIIDGRRLKSINQWYDKQFARLQSINDKQGTAGTTTQQDRLCYKHNRQVSDYVNKVVSYVINYCVHQNVGNVVLGYNPSFQQNSNMGSRNNQVFSKFPFGLFKHKLTHACSVKGINFIIQEESYTSKASFFDTDEIPIFDENSCVTYKFSGRRVHRGLYKSSTGYTYNADVNGALNILCKSNVVDLTILYSRGAVDTPSRIRLA